MLSSGVSSSKLKVCCLPVTWSGSSLFLALLAALPCKVTVRNFGWLSTPDSLVILSASLPVDRLFQVRLCTLKVFSESFQLPDMQLAILSHSSLIDGQFQVRFCSSNTPLEASLQKPTEWSNWQ